MLVKSFDCFYFVGSLRCFAQVLLEPQAYSDFGCMQDLSQLRRR